MSKRVLILGSSGHLGTALVKALEEHPLVERIVGVDVAQPPESPSPKFRHYKADIRDEFLLRSIIEEEAIDTVFHLAFVPGEPANPVRAREITISGTLTALEAANKSSCARRLVIMSSSFAYGARRNNPEFIKEEQPLRAATLRYGMHKRLMEEELAQSMPQARKSLNVVVLRCCATAGDATARLLCSGSTVFSVLFRKGAFQFIAESDLLNVMMRVLEAGELRGAYNVAPDDYATIDQLCRAAGKTKIPVPYFILWLSFLTARWMRPAGRLTERLVSYLAYPVVVSNEKLKKALGIQFSKGSLAAFAEGTPSTAALTKEKISV